MRLSRLALVLCLGAAVAAHAGKAACENPRNVFDSFYCFDKLYQAADTELNQVYGALAKQLNPDAKAKLKKGQLAWIKQRDDACTYQDNRGAFLNLDCAVEQTTSRLGFLRDRLRECESMSCQADKL